MNSLQRDHFENILLINFSGTIKPLKPESAEIIEQFKDGSFGFSCLGLTLYINGYNLRGKSSQYPQGIFYYDGENIFGIGFFQKEISNQNGHVFIVAPRGENWLQATNRFVDFIRQTNDISPSSIYIRHLSEKQYNEVISAGYLPIKKSPWHPIAHSEDETFNHRLVDLNELLTIRVLQDTLKINLLNGADNRQFRKKPRAAYSRFSNFLKRNNLTLVIEEYIPEKHQDIAKDMVTRHFGSLKNPIGSTPEDYWGLIYFTPLELHKHRFFRYIGYLKKDEDLVPVLLFLGEDIGCNTVGIYASFALRGMEFQNILSVYDTIGFSALSQFCYLQIFGLIKKRGFHFVDMGGSETYELDRFKRQLGAKESMTYWAIAE